jgi:hypothetical protein
MPWRLSTRCAAVMLSRVCRPRAPSVPSPRVAKYIGMPVISTDFEPALRRRKPAVDDAAHADAVVAEPEGAAPVRLGSLRSTQREGSSVNKARTCLLRSRRGGVAFSRVRPRTSNPQRPRAGTYASRVGRTANLQGAVAGRQTAARCKHSIPRVSSSVGPRGGLFPCLAGSIFSSRDGAVIAARARSAI